MSDEMKPKVWTRREMLTASGKAIVGGVALLGVPTILRAQAKEPVKIGLVFAKQGTWTAQGEQLASGIELAMQQAGGSLLGRKVEFVWYDEPNPQSAQQNMEKMIQTDKVVAVIGGTNSGTSLAMASVAKRLKVPYIAPNAAARDITGKECNSYTFRTLTTTPVACRAMAPVLLAHGKRWYFLQANYAFGQDVYNSMAAELKAAGGTEVGNDATPLNTTDFSSFILKIRQAKPDVVVAGIPGGDLSTFLKQWKDMGMKGKIPIACPIIGDADLWALSQEAATGYFGKPWHFSTADNPAADKALVKDYMAKYGKPPADKVWLGWMSMRALIQGINHAKSFEGGDIVKGLETIRIDEGGSQAYYRAWDHQMLRKCMVFKVKDQITDKWDWLDAVSFEPKNPADLDRLFGTPQEIGCKMESA